MTTIARNASNDFTIQNGRIVTASGIEAYKNILQSAVLTISGEIQLDINRGIPYIDTVFDGNDKLMQWKSDLFDTINSYDFVRDILEFNMSRDYVNKIIHYTMTILTDLGKITLDNSK